MERVRLALCGYYGKQNIGDDLMAYWLPEVLSPDHQVHVSLYSDDHSRRVINGLQSPTHLDAHAIVFGGGGIISPDFWAFREGGIEKIIASGKPVFFFNVNVYPEAFMGAAFTDQIRQLNAVWWVRDQNSVDILAEHGIESSLLPDITFRAGVIAPALRKTRRKSVVSVFLNHNAFMPYFKPKDMIAWAHAHVGVCALAHHLDWLASFGWKVQLIPAQTAQFLDDCIPAALVYAQCHDQINITWTKRAVSWQKTINIIRDSDMVLSQRYHTTTIALASGVPVVDVTHHLKNAGLLQDIGIESLSIPYETLCHQQLIDATAKAEAMVDYERKVAAYRADTHLRWRQFDEEWAVITKSLKRGAL